MIFCTTSGRNTEGYSYLRQPPLVEEGDDFSLSPLLVLLRRRLAESDTSRAEERLILARADIIDLVRLYHWRRNHRQD